MSVELLAGTVMDSAAALMNDTAKSVYTYIVQVPYLNMAMLELKEFFELNDVPVVDTVSEVIEVDAGVTVIAFPPDPPIADTPYLPSDLVEPSILWERARDIDPYTRMTRVDVLPLEMAGTEINQIIYYVWQSQEIRFFAANADNDVKMDYIRDIFAPAEDEDSEINILNAQSFLQYRLAGLLAEFVEENPERANNLNGFASLGMDRVLGIGTKGRQYIQTRHRPFRASFKRRSRM